ncbi:MAG: dockerin type I domain-containing protein, partial [Phycisphaerae bacterium]
NDVFVVEGQWANGQHVWVSQGDGVSFPIYLSSQGDFDQFPQPTGPFDVVGIFDQEAGLGTWPPPDPPYTGDYRIWVKSSAGIIPKLADLDYDGDVDLADWDLLVQAVTGPGQPTPNPHADLDADGDCDLRDMAIFCHRFTGPP